MHFHDFIVPLMVSPVYPWLSFGVGTKAARRRPVECPSCTACALWEANFAWSRRRGPGEWGVDDFTTAVGRTEVVVVAGK